MKNIFLQTTFCLLFAISFTACFHNDHDISIQVKNTDDKYEFDAYYPVSKTRDVQDYINESISPNGLFTSTHDYFNVDTQLQDGTHLHVKSSPGKMDIFIDKNDNSVESVMRIERMCEGIKKLLTQK